MIVVLFEVTQPALAHATYTIAHEISAKHNGYTMQRLSNDV